MKLISILRNDGNVSLRGVADHKDIAEQVAAWEKEHSADGWKAVQFREINPADLPAHRSFRAALGVDGGINMRFAVELTKQRLRNERAPLLADLDVQYMRAIEAGDAEKQAAVVAEKQRLRDITKLAEQCRDPQQLKALTC